MGTVGLALLGRDDPNRTFRRTVRHVRPQNIKLLSRMIKANSNRVIGLASWEVHGNEAKLM